MIPPLSIVLLTTGRQPLLRFSILSLLPQAGALVDFTVSINSQVPKEIETTKKILRELDPNGMIRIIQPEKSLSVYEHYHFALDHAPQEIVLIAHDDEIYNAGLIAELQTGFSDPSVSFVSGGLMKVEILGANLSLVTCNASRGTVTVGGSEWLKSAGEVYPPFCFSALTLHKRFIDPALFSAASTSADCLAATHQSLGGKVYHSQKIFATWLQLSSRNSRWYVLRPGLTATWKEYSSYFARVADPDLLQLSAASKINSGRMFTRMFFCVAVLRGDPTMIRTCIEKLGEIHPLRARLFSCFGYPMVYRPLSGLMRCMAAARRLLMGHHRVQPKHLSNGAQVLEVEPAFWESYLKAASSLA